MKYTAVEWFWNKISLKLSVEQINEFLPEFEQAKEIGREQRGYTEEQTKQIWKAGQEYWKTSGSSITFEELIETFNTKEK